MNTIDPRPTVCVTLAALVFLGLSLPLHAAPPYAFPDQPGVLSPAEIQDATEAMRPMLKGEPVLPLVASGKRSPEHTLPAYALFAAPLADFSREIKIRRQIVCNFFRPTGKWQCNAPHDEFRMSANGLEHVFSHQITQGTGNKRAAVDAAAFMYSKCFDTQFEEIGGEPFAPSPDADFVSGVLDEGKRFNIVTGPIGDGNSYRLVKTDKSADNCGFKIQHARMAKSGVMIPASAAREYAREMEKLAAQEREKFAAQKREKVPEERRASGGQPREPGPKADTTLFEILGLIFLIAVPIAAGQFASRYALTSEKPESARLRAFLVTWALSIALGIVAGLVLDMAGPPSMMPASVVFGMVMVLFGAVAGMIAGWICARKVRQRIASAGAQL